MTLIYGFNLLCLKIKYEILEYLEPSYLNSNKDCEKNIKELYDTKLDISHKKFIMNSLIGNLGKKYNKKSKSMICNNLDTASVYQQMEGGHIIDMQDGKYYYCKNYKTNLTEGFLPIHIAIYDSMRMELYKLKNRMLECGLKIIGYKVDAIYFEKPKNNNINDYSNILKAFGCKSYTIRTNKKEEKVITIDEIKSKFVTYDENKTDFENIGALTYNDDKFNLIGEIIKKDIEIKPFAEEI